jgi:hypothetical protein
MSILALGLQDLRAGTRTAISLVLKAIIRGSKEGERSRRLESIIQ